MYQSNKNKNCSTTNKPSSVRIHKHKYKNLDLVDQKKKKYSIPGDDGILVKILTNYLYLKLLRFFFWKFIEVKRTISV